MNRNKAIGLGVLTAGAFLFLALAFNSPGAGLQAIQTSSAVQIPQALVLAFEGLLFGLIMAGFTWLLNAIGLNLSEIAAPLAGILSGFLLGLAQQWIDFQPVTSDPFILMVLNILVIIFTGLGGLFLLTKRNTII